MVTYSFLELGVNKEAAEKILELAHKTGALLYGDFTLSSGKKSGHYFNGKKITLSPDGAYWVGKAVFEELAKDDVDAVGGLAIGADPIATATAVVSYLEGKPIPAFIVREERKEHGTLEKIAGHLQGGFRVAIVDDVITTGESLTKAIDAVKAQGCEVVKIIVLVDRHEGGSDKLRQAGYQVTAFIDLWPSGKATVGDSSATKGEFKEGLLRR